MKKLKIKALGASFEAAEMPSWLFMVMILTAALVAITYIALRA